jgi:hypothetical protein
MTFNHRSPFLWATLASAIVIAACGGGGSKAPLAPDPTSSNESGSDSPLSDSPFDTDGGAPAEAKADASSPNDAPVDKGTTAQQGNEEGARALLTQFVAPNADHAALTKSLRPSTGDYKSLFDAEAAAKVESAQAKDWASNKAVKIWSATGSDLVKGTGSAKEFPGGYKKIAKHLAPSATFFRFKFVEAGKDTGTAYDGLAFVNGHWVIAPKPWRALEGKGGMDDEAEAAPQDTKHAPKKKPKAGKKK